MFEMGLFWGRLNRERVFFLIPDKLPEVTDNTLDFVENYHLASDLNGLNVLTYNVREKDYNYNAAVNVACSHILQEISRLENFEHPEDIIPTLRSVVSFYRKFNHNVISREDDHLDYLTAAVQTSYNANCVGFNVDGVALWRADHERIEQISGNVGKGKSYPFTVNQNLEKGQHKILVVEAYLNSRIEFIDSSIGLEKQYLLCYPVGKHYVLSIHIMGYKMISNEKMEFLYDVNQGLIGTVHNLLGGDWS